MVYYIADDIGENQIRAARFRSGEIEQVNFFSRPTHQEGINAGENRISIIHRVWPENCKPGSVGIASPDYLKLTQGVVINTKYPDWVDYHLVDLQQEQFNVLKYRLQRKPRSSRRMEILPG